MNKQVSDEMELIEAAAMRQFRQSPEGLKIIAETNEDELEATLSGAFQKVKSNLMVQIVNSAAMADIISEKLNALDLETK